MATKTTIKSDLTFAGAIARVQPGLAAWRHQRKHREAIPEDLWRRMVPLARRYGLSPVAQALKVNYTSLKRRLVAGRSLPASVPRAAPGFVEVPVNGWPGASQWLIELEDSYGCKLTLRMAPSDSVAALALAQGLWSHRA
jgi:hypothetical protein